MDTISNMIIQIKNAGNAGHDHVRVPGSKINLAIANVLKKEGFIKDFEEKKEKIKPIINIFLISENRVSKIKGVSRISKPSKRVYKKYSDIRPVKNGYGALIISTSSGIMSGQEARRAKLGGEALFSIW